MTRRLSLAIDEALEITGPNPHGTAETNDQQTLFGDMSPDLALA